MKCEISCPLALSRAHQFDKIFPQLNVGFAQSISYFLKAISRIYNSMVFKTSKDENSMNQSMS
jgi:hypothetical protein